MTSFDSKTKIKESIALTAFPVVAAVSLPGLIVDTEGYESYTIIAWLEQFAAGDASFDIEHGNNSLLADAEAVPSQFIIGDISAILLGVADKTARIGYVGKKRYVRINTTTANAPDFILGAMGVLGDARSNPTS